ncbi:MAG: SusC/RagA family TonB-linked outer membrane protein [Alloprevotella sp.]
MIKRIKTVSLMLLLMGLPAGAAYAETSLIETVEIVQQSGAATGTVVDATGEPLTGASVIVKGTTKGAMVDNDGKFSIAGVKQGQTLRISFIGYVPQEVKWEGQPLSVVLEEDNNTLDEVVVTALGIKRQARSLGYSTTSVSGEDFAMARDLNVGNALSGKVAGVSVSGNSTGSGGSSRVIIRGAASLTGNNMPLYVIDGVPYDNTNQGSAGTWGGMDLGDGLSNINPDDIESMQVLKGAAASALYGFRGGNGAILITTKSGKKGKPMSIEFNNNITFNKIYDYRDFQTVYGQGTDGKRPTTADAAKETETSNWGELMQGQTATNWLGKEYAYNYIDNWGNFYRTGIDETASVSISGASDKLQYRFGVTNLAQKGILPNSGLSQQTISMNTTYDILKNLHLNVTANYVFDKSKGRSNLSDGNGNTNASLLYHANSFDIRWMEGDADWGTNADGSEMISGNNVYFNNPYWLQYRKTNDMNRNRLTGAMNLRWDITEWLYVQGAVQRDGYNYDFKQVQPIGAAADPAGWMSEYEKSYSEMNLNYLIGFNKAWGDWSVDLSLGGNRQRNITKTFYVTDGGRPFVVDGLWSPNNLSDKRSKKEYSEYRVNSVYFTADFGWRNQLFLNVTGRNDWFSTLAPESNSYFYPSVTLSWVFSDTFKHGENFTFGKLRASWASASNGTSPYQNLLLYKLRDYTVNGQNMVTQNNNNRYPNANLKPVRISEYEVGLNLAFFNNRLSFDMAYYVKNTKDDIAVISTSSTSGYSSMVANVGEIRNDGIEFMVDATPVRNSNFTWNTTFNCAYNNSEVKYLGEGVEQLSIDGASSRSGGVTVRNIVGERYGMLYGYKAKRDENGNLLLKDGLPQREETQSTLGCGVYKFTGGWRNTFTYKNFSLGFLLDFKAGAKLFSGTNLTLYGNGLHKNTLEGRLGYDDPNAKNFVAQGIDEATGQPNTVAVRAQDYWGQWGEIGEEFTYNASFIKLRELTFGYDFSSLLQNQKVVKGLTLSLVARNLWTIMKHTPNIDPEAAYNNSNGQGLELNGYPATRNVGFNLNIKF